MALINIDKLSDKQKESFIEGWEAAGGYMGDIESPSPWCAPWTYCGILELKGNNAKEWGAYWWSLCEYEVETELREAME